MLTDAHTRRFPYLRLSVTDACNFRCNYCLPNGYQRPAEWEAPLTLDEIERLVRAFADLGVRKVRLTGGEPTVRRDLPELVARVRRVTRVETVALSTNGYRLRALVPQLVDAGLDAVNVSVDSLDPGRFAQITGHDALDAVIEGIDSALTAGLVVKTNAVLLGDCNDDEVERFLCFMTERPVTVRFIELMRTADNELFFLRRHRGLAALAERLEANGFVRQQRADTAGPAIEYRHPSKRGAVGLITPYAEGFCASCNRLRVTSQGALRLCLFGESNLPLRHLLGEDGREREIEACVRAALAAKPPAHRLAEGDHGNARNLAQMGG